MPRTKTANQTAIINLLKEHGECTLDFILANLPYEVTRYNLNIKMARLVILGYAYRVSVGVYSFRSHEKKSDHLPLKDIYYGF